MLPLNPCIPEFCICARQWVRLVVWYRLFLLISSLNLLLFVSFLNGSTNEPLFYHSWLSKDVTSSVQARWGKNNKVINLIFPKAKVSLRSSWKEEGKKKKKEKSCFETWESCFPNLVSLQQLLGYFPYWRADPNFKITMATTHGYINFSM